MISQLLYRLYELKLRREIRRQPLPRHIGLILDGNRRYARKNGLTQYRKAYDRGADKLDDLIVWCDELGIKALTLWVFSIDNLKRSDEEVEAILGAVESKISSLADSPMVQRHRVRIRAVGRLDLLPPSTIAVMRNAEEATAKNRGLTITIAIAYGGREEIADAVRSLVRDRLGEGVSTAEILDGITPEAIDAHLYTAGLPDPDLIIRTSGELRLSGFLLWQSAQSELYFTDVNWPEFRRIDLYRAIRAFQHRARRFGR